MGKAKDKQRQIAQTADTHDPLGWLYHPSTGNYLTIAAAVVLQFLIILLPLVGPAGSVAPHAKTNVLAWLAVLFTAMVLSGLALFSKLKRSAADGSRFPVLSAVILSFTVFLLFAQFAGMLRV